MNYLSIFSGIEAATAAWHPLGWSPLAFSEIEPFPSAVLAHHHPDVPNLGDMTKYEEWPICSCLRRELPRDQRGSCCNSDDDGRLPSKPERRRNDISSTTPTPNCETCGHPIIDLLVGGTPCQAFSVAGLRKGLEDPRGNLTLTFLAMADRFRPTWVVWENVPGVLSDKSNAFGMFLSGLGELGYEYAYRVLDAQHFGVAQRRRRVFVVASIGGVHPGKVLFEPESLCRDLTPSRGEGEGAAGGVGVGFTSSSFSRYEEGIGTLRSQGGDIGGGSETLAVIPNVGGALCKNDHGGLTGQEAANGHVIPVVGALTVKGPTAMGSPEVDAGHYIAFEPRCARNGRGMPDAVVPPLKAESGTTGKGDGAPCVAFYSNEGLCDTIKDDGTCPPVKVGSGGSSGTPPAVAFSCKDHGADAGEVSPTLRSMSHDGSHANGGGHVAIASTAVRRLTPVECERLQGFPDDHTKIPWRGKPADQCPDGPRYKALGNSMAVPVMAWIGERIAKFSGA